MERIFELQELAAVREHHRNKRIVFVTGVFDLTHPGHILFLEAARAIGDLLVAGVGNDAQVGKLKPGRPIWSGTWRAMMVASLKPVDYCFIGPPETVEHPLKIVEMGLASFKPDVYVVNDDAFDIPHRRVLADHFGVEFMVIPCASYPREVVQFSTTNLLRKLRQAGE